jgi:membrane protease YdiL (CAAX protease family)
VDFNLIDVTIRTILMLVIALFLTIITVAGVKLLKIDIKDFKQRTSPRFMLVALIANLLFIYSVNLLLHLLDQQNIKTLGFSFSLSQIVFSVLALLVTFGTGIIYVFSLNSKKINHIEYSPKNFIHLKESWSLILSFIVLFVASLQEEIMFRGYLAFIFQNYSLIVSMLLSTVIFTVWHFIGNKVNVYQAVDWFAGGLLLFFVYVESSSIWAAAIVHFSRNLTNVLIFNIAQKHSLFKWKSPILPKYKTIYVMICSFGIALLTYIFFQ